MKEDILEGLRNALSKGETLQQAMQSFYNAGYEVKDIQEAARELQSKTPQTLQNTNPKEIHNKQPIQPKKKLFPKPPQKVSNYEQKPKNPRKTLLIIISILLVIILIGFGVIYFFKEQILEFFRNLFG